MSLTERIHKTDEQRRHDATEAFKARVNALRPGSFVTPDERPAWLRRLQAKDMTDTVLER